MARYVFLSAYYLAAQSPLRAKWNRRYSQAQEKGGRLYLAALCDSPKKRKGAPRTLVEENSFPRQRSYERVTAGSAECRRGVEGCKENKLLQLPAATCSIVGIRIQPSSDYEFPLKCESQLREIGRQDGHIALQTLPMNLNSVNLK